MTGLTGTSQDWRVAESMGLLTARPRDDIAPVDYDIDPVVGQLLAAIAMQLFDERVVLLREFFGMKGAPSLIDVFAQFIGLANSVAANAREHAELIAIMNGMHYISAEKINMPSIVGALMGLVIAAEISAEPLCHGCAYRRGSVANQCLPTVLDATDCVHPGEVSFMCHEGIGEDDQPVAACRGFAQQRAAKKRADKCA